MIQLLNAREQASERARCPLSRSSDSRRRPHDLSTLPRPSPPPRPPLISERSRHSESLLIRAENNTSYVMNENESDKNGTNYKSIWWCLSPKRFEKVIKLPIFVSTKFERYGEQFFPSKLFHPWHLSSMGNLDLYLRLKLPTNVLPFVVVWLAITRQKNLLVRQMSEYDKQKSNYLRVGMREKKPFSVRRKGLL